MKTLVKILHDYARSKKTQYNHVISYKYFCQCTVRLSGTAIDAHMDSHFRSDSPRKFAKLDVMDSMIPRIRGSIPVLALSARNIRRSVVPRRNGGGSYDRNTWNVRHVAGESICVVLRR